MKLALPNEKCRDITDIKVYLAGKVMNIDPVDSCDISKKDSEFEDEDEDDGIRYGYNDWRYELLMGIKHGDITEESEFISRFPKLLYNGPYINGMGHGGFDRGNPHKSCDNYETLYGRCMEQIKNSDMFFAWIDSYDCYGTIAEIGYASRIFGLRVFIAFKKDMDFKDLGFVKQFALETTDKFENPSDALEFFANSWWFQTPVGLQICPDHQEMSRKETIDRTFQNLKTTMYNLLESNEGLQKQQNMIKKILNC